jgi:hypothetical protein
VHYELGNFDLLEYIIKSTYRYLNKRQRDHDVEVVILDHMKQLARKKSKVGNTEIFISLKKELESQLDHGSSKVLLEYFNYPLWVESKISGQSFKKTAKEKFSQLETA